MLGYIDWQPSVEAFSLGSYSVRWYSLLWCVGLLCAYLIVQRLYKHQKIGEEKFEPLFLVPDWDIASFMSLGIT